MDRENYRRVTEIISPFSGVEFIPDKYLLPAGDRGTRTHDWIEAKLNGEEKEREADILPYLVSFEKFWESSSHAFKDGEMVQEERLYCDYLRVSGKFDCLFKTKNKTYVFDWKTSSRPHKSWRLQGAAYRYLLETNGYENLENIMFVKLAKNGSKPTLYKYDSHEEDLETFKKCVELYDWFDMEKTRKKWS